MTRVKERNDPLLNVLPFAVMFFSLFVYFRFFADYITYYQEKNTLFVLSYDYLKEHLDQPGSILIYFSNLVTSFYYYPSAGAIFVSILICLTAFLISNTISYLSGNKSVMIPLLFGLILFFFHTNYQYLAYNTLGLLLQVSFFCLTVRYLKGWLPVFFFPFWYLITGGFAWIFALMFSVHILIRSLKKGWLKIVALWFTGYATIFLLKEFVLFQSLETLLIFPFTDKGTGSQSNIFVMYAVLIGLIPLIALLNKGLQKKVRLPGILQKLAPSLTLLIIVTSVSILRFDNKTRQYFAVEKLFSQERFDKVIEYNKTNPSNNILTIYLNNIALCETGILNDQLFNFRQDPDGRTLFLKWEMSSEILRRGGYFYYTIGMINEAQRWAYENMIMKGITSEDLKMLIRTEMIIGNYETAAKYISILKKTFFYRNEAKVYEKLLFDDKAVDADHLLGLKRRVMIRHDFFSVTDDPYVNVERILAFDSLNRKAYDYKLAYMLLKKDYHGIEAQLKELGRFGYTRIPVHIEEAAEAYKVLNLGPVTCQGTLPFSTGTALRFNQFLQTFQLYGNNLKSAEPALRQKYGNTFWYWAFYR